MNQQEQMRVESEIKEENLVSEPENLGPFRIINQNWDQQRDFPKCCNWTLQQNAKYAAFIIKYSSFLNGKSCSRVWTVFKTMSKFIKSRNFRQCKQHHQRMCDKFQDLDNIIHHLDRSSQQFVDLLQEQTIALNQHIENLIKQVKQVGKKKAQKVEDPQCMDLQKQKKKPIKIPSQNNPLFLTLQLQPRVQQKQLSFQQQQALCQNLFNKWSCKLHLISKLTTL